MDGVSSTGLQVRGMRRQYYPSVTHKGETEAADTVTVRQTKATSLMGAAESVADASGRNCSALLSHIYTGHNLNTSQSGIG